MRNLTPDTLPTVEGFFEVEARIYPDDLKGIIEFYLTSSSEPGVCMNHDIRNKPGVFLGRDNRWREMDLIFEPQGGFRVPYPWEASTKSEVNQAEVKVSCYDYGAYGKVRAGAHVKYYFKDTGTWEEGGWGPEEGVKVPTDNDGNNIADAWHGNYIAGTRNPGRARDDGDDQPPHGSQGDGLSRYEEYRGFYVQGSHTRTIPISPSRDLFIHNDEANPVLPYPTHFGPSARVNVHWVTFEELGEFGRVINRFNESHHIVDQHGLWLINGDLGWPGPWDEGYWGVAGPPPGGSPRFHPQLIVDIEQIRADLPGASEEGIDKVIQYVACHELGHGVNMQHHRRQIVIGSHRIVVEDPYGGDPCYMRYIHLDTFRNAISQGDIDFNDINLAPGFCSEPTCLPSVDISDAP